MRNFISIIFTKLLVLSFHILYCQKKQTYIDTSGLHQFINISSSESSIYKQKGDKCIFFIDKKVYTSIPDSFKKQLGDRKKSIFFRDNSNRFHFNQEISSQDSLFLVSFLQKKTKYNFIVVVH